MMTSICAWCKNELTQEEGETSVLPFFGMCGNCREMFFPRTGAPKFRRALDRLDVPVLAMDDDTKIVIANDAACHLFGKEREEIERKRSGDLFACTNTWLPGGCGKAPGCTNCGLREVVKDTYTTGKGHESVHATVTCGSPGRSHKLELLLSTMKAGELVVVKMVPI
ncbi:MAG TPA: PAS domain-containing protein [Geobacteraceae bacterium]